MDASPARLLCDEMLGGLARWLRAAGHDAELERGRDDGELCDRARREGRLLLSSDQGVFDRNVVRCGEVRALFVPRGERAVASLAFVMKALALPRLEPRCMDCGGALAVVAKADVEGEAPPRTFETTERFWRCERCGKLLWRGTHWLRIERALAAAAEGRVEPRDARRR
jgi:hypothetical protein